MSYTSIFFKVLSGVFGICGAGLIIDGAVILDSDKMIGDMKLSYTIFIIGGVMIGLSLFILLCVLCQSISNAHYDPDSNFNHFWPWYIFYNTYQTFDNPKDNEDGHKHHDHAHHHNTRPIPIHQTSNNHPASTYSNHHYHGTDHRYFPSQTNYYSFEPSSFTSHTSHSSSYHHTNYNSETGF